MRLHSSSLSLAVAVLFAAVACVTVRAQTDVGLSIYGAFSGTTNGSSLRESPSNAAGGIIEVRHIKNTLIGYEATYSFNRANQVYTYTGFIGCPAGFGTCTVAPVPVSANAHEITGDWVVSAHVATFRPFALAGAGVLLNEPVSGQSLTQSSTTAVYVYGAGLDWKVLPHIGLRFQYRGNVYRAPDIITEFGSVDAFKHSAEPMIGAYFRF